MKIFLDRITDLLEITELLEKGRRLRGKAAYVICTSVCDEAAPAFIALFQETFKYLGMHFGGYLHANCDGGYFPAKYEADVQSFVALLSGRSLVRKA